MATTHIISIQAIIDDNNTLQLESPEGSLQLVQGSWEFTLKNQKDLAQYTVGDFTTSEGTAFCVQVVGKNGESPIAWDKSEGICRSPAAEAGSDLEFIVSATRVLGASTAPQSGDNSLVIDDFELFVHGSRIRTRPPGGGGEDFLGG